MPEIYMQEGPYRSSDKEPATQPKSESESINLIEEEKENTNEAD